MNNRARFAACCAGWALCVNAIAINHVQAQPAWATFNGAMPVGSASNAINQTHVATVVGGGRGAGTASLTFSVSGGVGAWNGFGVGAGDDGYFSAPNLPQPGITFTNGAPGYNGGVPAAASASFATAYNLPGAPTGTPAPSDRSALYFDAGDGTTALVAWDFTTLNGGTLLAGSWIFVDGIDQGERVVLTGPTGWIGSIHTADSTLPRPAQPGVPPTVSAPQFPVCAPAMVMTSTTIQLEGRYGDLSNLAPTCSNVPVPVQGVTVGYTKGMDSVGVWIKTAIDLPSLTLTASDQDISPRSPQTNAYLGPDNNFVLGVGFIAETVSPSVPGARGIWLAILAGGLIAPAYFARQRARVRKGAAFPA